MSLCVDAEFGELQSVDVAVGCAVLCLSGLHWAGLHRAGWTVLGCAGLSYTGLCWARLHWNVLGLAALGCIGLGSQAPTGCTGLARLVSVPVCHLLSCEDRCNHTGSTWCCIQSLNRVMMSFSLM